MSGHEMTAALAGRMAVSVILIIVGYGLLILAIARFMAWVSSMYPKALATTPAEYYGVEPYQEADDYSDAVEGTEPPRRSA